MYSLKRVIRYWVACDGVTCARTGSGCLVVASTVVVSEVMVRAGPYVYVHVCLYVCV